MDRRLFISLLLASCNKMSLRYFHSQNVASGSSPLGANDVGIFVQFGHSNNGRSLVSELPAGAEFDKFRTATIPDSTIINLRTNPTTPAALAPGSNTILDNSGEFGAEVAVSRLFVDDYTNSIYVVKGGWSSATLDYNGGANINFAPTGTNSKTQAVLDAMELAVQSIQNDGKNPVLIGVLMILGQQDSINATYSADYLTNMNTFWANFTNKWNTIASSYGINSYYKKIIMRMDGSGDVLAVYRDTVRTAQQDFCNTPSNNAVLINIDDLGLRDVEGHLSAEGQIDFGTRVYNEIVADLNS